MSCDSNDKTNCPAVCLNVLKNTDGQCAGGQDQCSVLRSTTSQGEICRNWLNNTETPEFQANYKSLICGPNATVENGNLPECACYQISDPSKYPDIYSEYQTIENALGSEVTKYPPQCWYRPCQHTGNATNFWDIPQENLSTAKCSGICGVNIDTQGSENVDLSNVNLTVVCPNKQVVKEKINEHIPGQTDSSNEIVNLSMHDIFYFSTSIIAGIITGAIILKLKK